MKKQNDTKLKHRQKIGPVGEAILLSVFVVGALSVVALLPGVSYCIAPFLKKKKYSPKQAVNRNLESLIRHGVLRRFVDGQGDVKIELTKRGKWEAMIRFGSRNEKKESWDGSWRIVIFDVPQSKNAMRNELRRAMGLYGFTMLQQSVWVYPYPCDDFVEMLKTYLGISNEVLYLRAQYIENDKHLRKEFGI